MPYHVLSRYVDELATQSGFYFRNGLYGEVVSARQPLGYLRFSFVESLGEIFLSEVLCFENFKIACSYLQFAVLPPGRGVAINIGQMLSPRAGDINNASPEEDSCWGCMSLQVVHSQGFEPWTH